MKVVSSKWMSVLAFFCISGISQNSFAWSSPYEGTEYDQEHVLEQFRSLAAESDLLQKKKQSSSMGVNCHQTIDAYTGKVVGNSNVPAASKSGSGAGAAR